MANGLFDAIAELLPASRWRELSWLAVATGPGSFTGTRLTLVLARTLAQQLQIPLYGYGSLRLIAERRRLELASRGPHWIGQTLPRRGWWLAITALMRLLLRRLSRQASIQLD